MHISTWCYTMLCLFLPMTLMAQAKHKYLDHALPEAWQENDSNFQQTLPVDDNWWRNFNDPVLDSLIDVAVKQNYSVQMACRPYRYGESQPAHTTGQLFTDAGTIGGMEPATKQRQHQ